MHKKSTKTCQTNRRSKIKIAGKRQKQNWLKKVGVDGQFEGLEGSGLNNGFGQVIPEVWELMGKKMTLKETDGKKSVNSTGI